MTFLTVINIILSISVKLKYVMMKICYT